MKIALTSESTIDLTPELLKKFDIKTINFSLFLGEDEFKDEEGISEKIFEYVNRTKTLPKTSALNQFEYSQFFTEILNQGYDAIIHIALSSKLSSTCTNAQRASTEFDNVFVVDSQQLSTGIAFVALYARKLIDQGQHSPQEIATLASKKASQIKVTFIVENLHFLHKGGRCSTIAVLGANLLRIKPQIAIVDGALKLEKKFMGSLIKVSEKYCNELLKDYPNASLETAFITHSSPMPEYVKIFETKLKEHGFKNIYETPAGGTVSAHCGPNCIGIVFDSNKDL